MSDGEWRYAAVSDNGPTLEPYFNETWAVCPSMLPSAQQKVLKELAIGAVRCLGFRDGVFHVECKMTSHGPHLIEVNARMGGGPVHETNLRVWGVDLVEETLFASAGIPSRPHIPGKKPVSGAVAYCDLNALSSGVLQNMDFLRPLRENEGVISAKPHVCAGDQVTGPQDGLPTWLVEVIVQRPTSKEAIDFLFQLQNEMKPLIL
jgi:carnosine synthase